MVRLAVIVLAVALVAAVPASAERVVFDSEWKEQRFSLFSGNSYRYGGSELTILSDDAVSLIYRSLDMARWRSREAQWAWAVERSVPPTDLTLKGGDDRNLSLYFVFLPPDEAKRLQGEPVRRLLGNSQARVLVYVWGGAHRRGEMLDSPYLGPRGRTVVLRPAGEGTHLETVDLASDFSRAFGGPAGALVGLAISGDSDDTGGAIRARINDLMLR